ncbi:MAG: hypothetical protein CMF60_07080 [Magnetococcales bacterium]|nr:hypothetical protein [Magnetococcales bacterium]|tara:strand:- start:5552 stop:6043 length:492 start_codon:yes stop_codon:yes gene_type:complete
MTNMKNTICVERNDLGVVKKRRLYPSIVVTMSKILEQFIERCSGYRSLCQKQSHAHHAVYVYGLSLGDANRVRHYRAKNTQGISLNVHDIHMAHIPLVTLPDKRLIKTLRKQFKDDKNSFAVMFQHKEDAEKFVAKVAKLAPSAVIYYDQMPHKQNEPLKQVS